MAYSAQKENKTIGEKNSNVAQNSRYYSHSWIANFDDYRRLNPVEVTIDSNNIIETLFNYQMYQFKFIIESLLFSTNLQNNTDVIFITCDVLREAKKALINSRLYKTLGVVYLSEVKDWNLIKNNSKRAQAVFVDSEYHSKASHFAFAFPTKNVPGLFNFTITLLDGSCSKITFASNEIKVPTLSFNIQIVK